MPLCQENLSTKKNVGNLNKTNFSINFKNSKVNEGSKHVKKFKENEHLLKALMNSDLTMNNNTKLKKGDLDEVIDKAKSPVANETKTSHSSANVTPMDFQSSSPTHKNTPLAKDTDQQNISSPRSIDGDSVFSVSKNFTATDFYPKSDNRFQLFQENHTAPFIINVERTGNVNKAFLDPAFVGKLSISKYPKGITEIFAISKKRWLFQPIIKN